MSGDLPAVSDDEQLTQVKAEARSIPAARQRNVAIADSLALGVEHRGTLVCDVDPHDAPAHHQDTRRHLFEPFFATKAPGNGYRVVAASSPKHAEALFAEHSRPSVCS